MKNKTASILLALTVLGMAVTVGQLTKAEFNDEIPFIYGIGGTPTGFDPLVVYDGSSGEVLVNHLEGLFGYDYSDPVLGLLPQLAVDMGSWSADGTEWTIGLREDVKWHDGTDFTADDVKWNWDRLSFLADAGLCDHSALWFNNDGDLMLASTTVVDDHTIKFTLAKEWNDFKMLQSFWGCALIKPVDGAAEALIGDDEYDLIIGTGPFVLDDYVAGEKIVLVANNDYYRGAPDIQKLIFKAFGSGAASNNALMAHECHVVRNVLFENWATIDADPDLSRGIQKTAVCFFYHLNVDNIDWAVRKAIQYAYNYEYHVDDVLAGRGAEIHTPIPNGMIGHNPDLPGLPYYNLTIARQYLLDDPVYGPLVLARVANLSSDDDWKACAADNPLATHNFTTFSTGFVPQIIDNMQYIGINILENIVGDWGTFLSGPFDSSEMVMGGWGPDYWHPINQIEHLYGTNSYYNWNALANTTIDDLMAESHLLTGAALEAKIDEIVTAVVVEQAATMYVHQRIHAIGWSAEYVSNVDDLFNVAGDKYFYNVQFTLSGAPPPDSSISWWDFFSSEIIFMGVILGVIVHVGIGIKLHKSGIRSRKNQEVFHENSPRHFPVQDQYCPSCGNKHSSLQVNFCGNCGHQL